MASAIARSPCDINAFLFTLYDTQLTLTKKIDEINKNANIAKSAGDDDLHKTAQHDSYDHMQYVSACIAVRRIYGGKLHGKIDKEYMKTIQKISPTEMFMALSLTIDAHRMKLREIKTMLSAEPDRDIRQTIEHDIKWVSDDIEALELLLALYGKDSEF